MTIFNAPHPANLDVPKAFFIAPLGELKAEQNYRKDVYKAVSEVCAGAGLVCERDIELRAGREFVQTILIGITWATLVICDLSDNRPNCYYELGIAQALGRPVCLIAKQGTQPAADITGIQILYYKDLRDLKRNLPNWIRDSALKNLPPYAPRDEWLGKFGEYALSKDGLLFSGWVVPDLSHSVNGKQLFDLTLRVAHVDRKTPLTGAVTFFLDEELERPKVTVTAKAGVALLEVGLIYGAFTVGATVHGLIKKRGREDGTKLELNLMRVPGSNPSFRYM